MSIVNNNEQTETTIKKVRVSKTAKWLRALPLRVTCDRMSAVESRLLKERVYYAVGLVRTEDELEANMTKCKSEEEISNAA